MNVDLRDYFAAHAPATQIAFAEAVAAKRVGCLPFVVGAERPDEVLLVRAELAYAWADAMLLARQVKDPLTKAA